MTRDFLMFLVTTFVVEPFQAELNQKLSTAQAPPAIISEVSECAKIAIPILADRAMSAPWWGASTMISVWIGTISPESVLTNAAPVCESAVRAVRPYLAAAKT